MTQTISLKISFNNNYGKFGIDRIPSPNLDIVYRSQYYEGRIYCSFDFSIR